MLCESSQTGNIQHWPLQFSIAPDTASIGYLFTTCVCGTSQRYLGHYSLSILYEVCQKNNETGFITLHMITLQGIPLT